MRLRLAAASVGGIRHVGLAAADVRSCRPGCHSMQACWNVAVSLQAASKHKLPGQLIKGGQMASHVVVVKEPSTLYKEALICDGHLQTDAAKEPVVIDIDYILLVGHFGPATGSGGKTQSNMHNESCPT
jgi:hypothetical protein